MDWAYCPFDGERLVWGPLQSDVSKEERKWLKASVEEAEAILRVIGVNPKQVNPMTLDNFPKVKVVVITDSSIDSIWRLTKEPDLADIIILGSGEWGSRGGREGGHNYGAVNEENLTSEQMGILARWLENGKGIWANYGWWGGGDAQGLWTLAGFQQKFGVDFTKGEHQGGRFFMTPDRENRVLQGVRRVALFGAGRGDHYGHFLTFADPKNAPSTEWSMSAAGTLQAAGVKIRGGRMAVVPIQIRDGYDSDVFRTNILLWLCGILNP